MSTNELTAKLKVAAKLRIEADSWPGSDGRIARMGVYIETGDDISTANILTLIEALEAAEKRIAELGGHLKSAHAFIENTEAFGHEAASGILKCGDSEWNVDASKESLAAAGITVKGDSE